MEPPFLSSVMGHAVTATILLSDWEKYGLSERVCYHFDLTEALADAASEAERSHLVNTSKTNNGRGDGTAEEEQEDEEPSVCGVVSLLECVPTTQWHRLTRRQKRALRNEIRNFNAAADCARGRRRQQERPTTGDCGGGGVAAMACHEPPKLPLRLSPASRVFFSYELTRIAFCLDASPTLTSTYGFTGGTGGGCCPMDRLGDMVRTFFSSLVEPVQAPGSTNDEGIWQPVLAVTVLAVYPRGTGGSQTSLLVRDFRVTDVASAEVLAEKIEAWALGEVEDEIARRLAQGNDGLAGNLLASYDAWTMPMYSSSLRDLLESGDAALSILSSAGRPCIVVATDGRSVACDGIIDIVSDTDRVDVPLVVLDLSSPESHSKFLLPQQGRPHSGFHLMNYDPGGAMFPLHLSDDTEALYGICRVTDGCFFDSKLLSLASSSRAGDISSESPLAADHFFSFMRHTIRPNAIQWYALFSLSPLSPTFHSAWGKLPPPDYIRRKLLGAAPNKVAAIPAPEPGTPGGSGGGGGSRADRDRVLQPYLTSQSFLRMSSSSTVGAISAIDARRTSAPSLEPQPTTTTQRRPQVRTTFSTYIVNPIRIKGLLLMRVKEGYRTKQYGQSTNEADKVFIQFTLPLELGTVLHYELSYKALPGHNQLVGFAHIKIELSGEASFIQTVKNDFLRPGGQPVRPVTMAQQVSAKLCKVLRWIRREDLLQSYLSPVKWSDQLSSADTPFVRRLGTLTPLQRRRHFRFDQFDCVCTGKMPYAHGDDFLSEFRDVDDGERELVDTIRGWSTKSIKDGRRYVRRTQSSGGGGLASYCVVEIHRSAVASRLFTIAVESFGGSGASDRLALLTSLKGILAGLRDVRVLPKQMGQFLVGVRMRHADQILFWKQRLLEGQHNHATYDLVKDPELLPLLMKRRTEIGGFLLLESNEDQALFAKLAPGESGRSRGPGDLVQYELAVLQNRVVVDLHMECASGEFFPFRTVDAFSSEKKTLSRFHRMLKSLKKRDLACGRALRSRTTLLRAFDEGRGPGPSTATSTAADIPDEEPQLSCVQRLLAYASQASMRLRFFHPCGSGAANQVLRSLTEEMLLSQAFGAKVAKLSVDPDAGVCDLGLGDWFLIEYDKYTMSMAHLSRSEKGGGSETEGCATSTFRELTFFTIGISDLYSRRDDVGDDDSEDDHISEHLCVSEFTDLIASAHKQNYSSAAYIALKSDTPPKFESFQAEDFNYVMSTLDFTEVTNVVIAGESSGCIGEASKLWQMISTIVLPITNESHCLFYKSSGRHELVFQLLDDDSDALSAFEGTTGSGPLSAEGEAGGGDDDDDEEEARRSHGSEEDLPSIEEDSLGVPSEPETPSRTAESTPIFVRFSMDGEPASVNDLACITRSTSLAAFVSVFARSNGRGRGSARKADLPYLPTSHLNAAVELTALLNAYVAEQTLERLRHHGSDIEEPDIRLAKACLRKARDVVTSTIEVFFYVAKRDTMVTASAPAGSDTEVEEGFKMLLTELKKNSSISFKFYGDGGAIVVDVEPDTDVLAYWCFVKVRRRRGVVSVEVHHPAGPEHSSRVMSSVHELISMCCHRVNQTLLLQRLHRSRTASVLLVPSEKEPVDTSQAGEESVPFRPGVFSCPVVFRTSFDLFHRCATNPAQVARTLEATVLHIFSVSNRRHVFVYKDESGRVFYMNLEAEGGGGDADGRIHLLVHGIDEPGPSVTKPLKGLLQKRLLLIACEFLSSLVAKNPQYSWKQADLTFVRSFEQEWLQLDNTKVSKRTPTERIYAFPVQAFDPVMILLYFRQNLCGSTYFHPLTCGGVSQDRNDDMPAGLDEENRFDQIFYYTNATSKLYAKFQAQSTLTEKGAEYARSAGSGIAIVELALVGPTGEEAMLAGATQPPLTYFETNVEDLRLREIKCDSADENNGNGGTGAGAKLRVKITDTCLKRDILHEWILLTLNQVLVGWTIERHLESMQHPSRLKPLTARGATELGDNEIMDQIYPGLPALCEILESSRSLPHPGVRKAEHIGVIRSSAVAPVALELLEKTIDQLRLESKGKASMNLLRDLSVIRLSRGQRPRLVQLSWESNRRKVLVKDASVGNDRIDTIRDSPIDSPEYICFYCFPNYIGESNAGKTSPPKLFEEVALDDGSGESGRLLKSLESTKQKLPWLFCRSFAFVLSVKRNKRTLTTYNWSMQVFKNVTSRLLEKANVFLASAGSSTDSLQRHSLKTLSPLSDSFKQTRSTHIRSASRRELKKEERPVSEIIDATTSMEGDPQAVLRGGPPRRPGRQANIRKPILKPKLIGKSQEGAAMRAVAASRARASSNLFKGASAGYSGVPPRSQADETRAANRNSASGQGRDSKRQLFPDRVDPDPGTQTDNELVKVQKGFESAMNAGKQMLQRRHTAQTETLRASAAILWPLQPKQTIACSVADFLLSHASLAWNDVSDLLPLPERVLGSFPLSFGQTLAAWTPGLRLVPVTSSHGSPTAPSRRNSVLLMGEVRNVRLLKCFGVVQICLMAVSEAGRTKFVVGCKGWAISLARRRKAARYKSQVLAEKDSAGMDKLLADLHATLPLEGMLFDYAASIVERAIRTENRDLEGSEALHLVRQLTSRYELRRQMKTLRSNYRAFEATIVLKSYNSRLIDMFEGPELFKWLTCNNSQRNLLPCGPGGLCFKREIVVRGTHSLCFLTCDEAASGKMQLVILCRTQGRDLYEFMFREGSNCAIAVVDQIASTAAGFAHEQLLAAATHLRRTFLWEKAAQSTPHSEPSTHEIGELLQLCTVKPITHHLSKNQSEAQPFLVILEDELGLDWGRCCEFMANDDAFYPSWPLQPNGNLFYLSAENVFLLVRIEEHSGKVKVDLVEQDESCGIEETHAIVVQKLTNFVLHYIWSTMTLG